MVIFHSYVKLPEGMIGKQMVKHIHSVGEIYEMIPTHTSSYPGFCPKIANDAKMIELLISIDDYDVKCKNVISFQGHRALIISFQGPSNVQIRPGVPYEYHAMTP